VQVRDRVPLRNAVASIFLERLTGFGAMICIAALGLVLAGTRDRSSITTIVVAGALVFGTLILFTVRCPSALADRLPAVFDGPRKFWREKVSGPMRSHLGAPYKVAAVMAISFLFQWGIVVIHTLLARAADAEVPLRELCVVYPLAAIAGMIPFSLNGVGFREGTYLLLSVRAGVPEAQSLMVGFLWTMVMWAASLPGGVLWWWRDADRRREATHSTDQLSSDPVGEHQT